MYIYKNGVLMYGNGIDWVVGVYGCLGITLSQIGVFEESGRKIEII
jgi:hypothetical protein